MSSVTLPKKVLARDCFTQLGNCLAIEPNRLDAILSGVQKIGMENIWLASEKAGPYPIFSPRIGDIIEHLQAEGVEVHIPGADAGGSADMGPPPYVIVNGTAIIPVSGPLSKQPTSLSHMFGGSSTVGMRKALAMAMKDAKAQRILFHIDSPGGTFSGTGDLGDDIYLASQKKPIASFIEDMGASAAYWIASQTSAIYASPYSLTGSIGVIWTIYDTSEAYAKDGIKVHAFKSTPGKAIYVDGMPLTEAQQKRIQTEVDATFKTFLSTVARGRGVSMAEARTMAADADIYHADEALAAGLIDSISTFQHALADFSASAPNLRVADIATSVKRKKQPTYSALGGGSGALFASAEIATSAAPDGEERISNTAPDNVGKQGDLEMSPPPQTPEGQSGATVTLTTEQFAALTKGAEAGARAESAITTMRNEQAETAKAALVAERDLAMADYALTKEQVNACPDLTSLRAMVSVKRAVARAAVDPNGGSGASKEKTADQLAADEITGWNATLKSRRESLAAGASIGSPEAA